MCFLAGPIYKVVEWVSLKTQFSPWSLRPEILSRAPDCPLLQNPGIYTGSYDPGHFALIILGKKHLKNDLSASLCEFMLICSKLEFASWPHIWDVRNRKLRRKAWIYYFLYIVFYTVLLNLSDFFFPEENSLPCVRYLL